MGWEYAQNTQILFRAKTIPSNHHFWSFLALTIAVCQIQMILMLIPLQSELFGLNMRKFYSDRKPFIENTIFGNKNWSVSNPIEINTHTSSK